MKRSLVFFALSLVGCSSGMRHAAEVVGFTDPVDVPVTVSVELDVSSSAGTPERLRTVLLWALVGVAEHPGSKLRIFGLGDALGSTRLLAEATSTPSASPAPAAVRSHQETFREKALEQLTSAAQPLWSTERRASPIAEGLAAIGRFPSSGWHVIVLLSDLRQESAESGNKGGFGHFECATLPSVSSWTARTKTLFAPLRGSMIIVAFASPLEPVAGARCASTNERYEQVLSVWMGALTASGATVHIFADDIPAPLDSFLGGAR